jgi:hypothetical protein
MLQVTDLTYVHLTIVKVCSPHLNSKPRCHAKARTECRRDSVYQEPHHGYHRRHHGDIRH